MGQVHLTVGVVDRNDLINGMEIEQEVWSEVKKVR